MYLSRFLNCGRGKARGGSEACPREGSRPRLAIESRPGLSPSSQAVDCQQPPTALPRMLVGSRLIRGGAFFSGSCWVSQVVENGKSVARFPTLSTSGTGTLSTWGILSTLGILSTKLLTQFSSQRRQPNVPTYISVFSSLLSVKTK